MTAESLICADRVGMAFPSGQRTLHDISLNIKAGELISLGLKLDPENLELAFLGRLLERESGTGNQPADR